MIKFEEKNNEFDDAEPLNGHQLRFERKLEKRFHSPTFSFNAWLKIAAGLLIIVAVGSVMYVNGDSPQNSIGLTDTPELNNKLPLEEAEFYYQKEFEKQFVAISNNYTDEESKGMIKESEVLIADLQKEYKNLELELQETGNYKVATAMILNYKSRISILEKLIEKLEYVNQLKNTEDEKINA